MSAFAQRLSRLRCTHSMLSRLSCDKRGYPQRTDAFLKREHSILARPCGHDTIYRVWEPRGNARNCVESAIHQSTDVESDDETMSNTFPEPMKENEYAHNLFHNSINYTNSTMRLSTTHSHVTNKETLELLEQNWDLMENDELLSAVKRLSYNIRYNEESIEPLKYKNAFEVIYMRCKNLNDDNLMTIMRHLVPFRQRLIGYFFYDNLCSQLNTECIKRFTQLNFNKVLVLCDLLYQLSYKRTSEYIWYAMRRLGNKPNRLTHHQLVQVLFFLNLCRKTPVNMYELEYRLEQCLDDLSINEVGIAALGFFKTGTRIRNAFLLRRIMKKTIAEIDHVDNVSIEAILKLIRYSMQLSEIKGLQELMDAIQPHEPRLTLMTLTHIAHACAKVSIYHKLIDKIMERLNNELKSARLKDFEKMIFVLANFNIHSDIYDKVIKELRDTWETSRAKEIATFPHIVSRIIGYMSYVNIYPTDLIQRIMQPTFIHKISSGNYYYIPREYCLLDYSLRLEVPEYDGPFLKPETCSYLAKKYLKECRGAEFSQLNLLLTSVLKTVQEIFNGTSHITVDRPLPHYATQDIIFCLDERNQLLPSKQFLSSFAPEEIKRVNKEDSKKWIALVMASPGLVIRNSNQPIGHLNTRIRQLSIIGYTPVVIKQPDWSKCKTQQERCDYIRSLIFKNSMPKVTNM